MLGIETAICDIGSRSGCYMYMKEINASGSMRTWKGMKNYLLWLTNSGMQFFIKENCYFIKHKTLFLNSRKEQEANTFAINLLVPDDLITEYMRYQECTIDQLSRILGYQKELIELRLK